MKTEKDLINEAIDLWQENKDKEAIAILELCNLETNAEANTLIGQIYLDAEKGVSNMKRSVKKAISYLEQGLKLGDAEAGLELANEYYHRDKPNFKKAEAFWNKSYALGNSQAGYELANFFVDHNPQQIEKAISIFKTLIDHNDWIGSSHLKLGRIYWNGIGIDPNPELALEHLTKAAEHHSSVAYRDLAFACYTGAQIPQNLDKALKYMELYASSSNSEFEKAQAELIMDAMKEGKQLFNTQK